MQKLNIGNDQYLVYEINIANKDAPFIVFAHGLMSDMNGFKATYLHDYCIKQGYNYIRFDNLGHGQSSGIYLENNIDSWLKALEQVIEQLVLTEAVLIGSSMGGWISLLASQRSNKIRGLITLAAAPDFTDDFWEGMSDVQRDTLKKEGIIEVIGRGNIKYKISYHQITEARQHLLLKNPSITLNIPVHLFHGAQDNIVPSAVALKLFDKIISPNLVLKMIKDANHQISRLQDLVIITNSIEEILKN